MPVLVRNILILAAIALGFGAVSLARESKIRIPGTDQGYAPEQPIAFSHRLHAGELEIDCQFCHAGAEKSRHAGLPPVATCMGCHRFVGAPANDIRVEEARAQAESRPARPIVSSEIMKIYRAMGLDSALRRDSSMEAADNGIGRPGIRWARVHNLADFVFFDHSRHVNGGVACSACHGAVETMERIEQVSDLTMGTCVNCHREKNAEFHAQGGKLDRASIDCSSCHI